MSNNPIPSPPSVIAVAALLLALGSPSSAIASGFDVFGMGARGSAMASASVSNADGYSALYYNPAGMVLTESTAGFGVFATFDNAEINLAERPDGYDIPDLGPATPAVPSEYRLRERQDTVGLDTMVGLFMGVTTNFGLERLRVGVAALIPVSGASQSLSVYSDEREQYFTNQLHFDVIGNRIHHQIVLFGAAYQVLDWLSLGLGLSFMPGAVFNSGVLVNDVTNMSDVSMNVGFSYEISSRFNAGILVFPDGPIRGGIAFRDKQSFVLTGVNEIQVRGFQGTEDYPLYQEIDLVVQYSPRQLIVGGSLVLDPLMLSLDVILSFWSDYPNNQNSPAGWSDTWSPRLGFETALNDHNWLRLGFAYEPSPVPEQSGRTNYVDNNRLVYSLGMEHHFAILGFELQVSWYAELQQLLSRTELKAALDEYPACEDGVTTICDEVPDDSINPETGETWPEAAGLQTGNPGFPGYTSGGLVGVAGLELSWDF